MNVSYGKGWFRDQKRALDAIDEARAKEAHEGRTLYTALLGEVARPDRIVELNNDYIGVEFLDDLLRDAVSYQFRELAPGRVFLTRATRRDFVDDSDRVAGGITLYFKPDGTTVAEREDFLQHTRSEKRIEADVSGNWESYPEFGDYRGIAAPGRFTFEIADT